MKTTICTIVLLAVCTINFAQVQVMVNKDSATRDKLEKISKNIKDRNLHLKNLENNVQKAQELQTTKNTTSNSYYAVIDNAERYKEFSGLYKNDKIQDPNAPTTKIYKQWKSERAMLKRAFTALDLRNVTASDRQEIYQLTNQILEGYTNTEGQYIIETYLSMYK